MRRRAPESQTSPLPVQATCTIIHASIQSNLRSPVCLFFTTRSKHALVLAKPSLFTMFRFTSRSGIMLPSKSNETCHKRTRPTNKREKERERHTHRQIARQPHYGDTWSDIKWRDMGPLAIPLTCTPNQYTVHRSRASTPNGGGHNLLSWQPPFPKTKGSLLGLVARIMPLYCLICRHELPRPVLAE